MGIAELVVSNNENEILVTYSLGSCIGLAIYDPEAKVGGMIHYMLPDSSLDSNRAEEKPAMFADTGVSALFDKAQALGLDKTRMRTVVAGAAQLMDDTGFFDMGKRNYDALKKIFGENTVIINAEDVGGHLNRTLFLDIATGRSWTKIAGHGVRKL